MTCKILWSCDLLYDLSFNLIFYLFLKSYHPRSQSYLFYLHFSTSLNQILSIQLYFHHSYVLKQSRYKACKLNIKA